MLLPALVPLGVAGAVTVPRSQYVARVGTGNAMGNVLVSDDARVGYLAQRLTDALARPLTSPGSEGLAKLVLARFDDRDLIPAFAEKALETLRDAASHNRMAVSATDPHVAVLFVAWNGTHREVQSGRVGNYFGALVSTARQLVDRGIQLEGFLEIDAYLRDNADSSRPEMPLSEVFQVDVEYSYLPGLAFGSNLNVPASLPKMIILNPSLCTPAERQVLAKLSAASS